jgi:protein TonB
MPSSGASVTDTDLKGNRHWDKPQDRLATMLFFAALLHGLVILGIRFNVIAPEARPLPTLEVLLVPDGAEEEPNPEAGYIAERSQHGAGTSRDVRRTSLPEATASLLEQRGLREGTAPEHSSGAESVGRSPVLASDTRSSERALAEAEQLAVDPAAVPMESRPLPQIGLNAVAAEEELRLRGDAAVNDRLLADTRESEIAAYLDAWKRRIERIGTSNFPDAARQRGRSGSPVIEVAIRSDGHLEEVTIRRSSGDRSLDRAAVRIVRLASPFDPFPPAMRGRYPVLRFAYEWRFLGSS